jgi:hypothetical protein
MAVLAIHPGEHLAEELKELGISASSLARQLHVPPNRITEILKWTAGDFRRHRLAACTFLRHDARVLAESAKSV